MKNKELRIKNEKGNTVPGFRFCICLQRVAVFVFLFCIAGKKNKRKASKQC